MSTLSDVTLVGAGILGLAVARELLIRHPGTRLTILEKEDRIASHQSGHNSGVIHSGIYYKPGSLKARLCVEGSKLLYSYCRERGVPHERCGKVIVAATEEELPRLAELHRRGLANGVRGLVGVGPERLAELEPHVHGLRALHSPETGIVDFGLFARALAEDVRGLGGVIRTGTQLTAIRQDGVRTVVETTAGDFRSRYLITCGGLYSDRLATMSGAPASPQIIPFRGSYYVLRPESAHLVRTLVYPVPDPAFPFLGVHFTKHISGAVWAGPNAVLALSREGYRWTDVNLGELWQTVSYAGFRALARTYWRTGVAEMYADSRRSVFASGLRRLVPELRDEDILPGQAGVRAQAISEDGQLLDDFWLDESPGVTHVRNAPSPGATSSLAVARSIVDSAERSFDLR